MTLDIIDFLSVFVPDPGLIEPRVYTSRLLVVVISDVIRDRFLIVPPQVSHEFPINFNPENPFCDGRFKAYF